MPPRKAIKIHMFWLFIIPLIMSMALFILYMMSIFDAMRTKQASSKITITSQPAPLPDVTPRPVVVDTSAIVRARDRLVDEDRLYPPYDRNTMGVTKEYYPEKLAGTFNTATRESDDEFRHIGYMSNSGSKQDQGGNVWKLYGRETYRGSGTAEFYVVPANKNYDIKLFINNAMLQTSSERIRGIYDVPSTLSLNHPMFSREPYHIELLPKSDLQSRYL